MDLRTDEWMDIYQRLVDRLKSVYGDDLRAVILYGSVARGTADRDSDIDIMVLVDISPERLKKYAEQLDEVSADFALGYLKVFSVIDVSYQEYEEWKTVSPFYQNVFREGVILYAA